MNEPASVTAESPAGASAGGHLEHPEPSAVAELAAQVEWTDSEAAADARRHAPREIGRMAGLAEWLAETQGRWPPTPARRVTLIRTDRVDERTRAVSEEAGVGVAPVELPAPGEAGRPTVHDADAAVRAGSAAVDALLDTDSDAEGADVILLSAGPASDAAGVLVGLYTGAEPVALLPRGADAVDTSAWIARAERLRDARRAALDLRNDPPELLAAAGSTAVAAAVGVLLRAAGRRVPIVLDGASATAAALVCQDVAPRSTRWCRIADASVNPVLTRASEELQTRPVLDLGTVDGSGIGAVCCVPVLRAAATLCAGAGTGP